MARGPYHRAPTVPRRSSATAGAGMHHGFDMEGSSSPAPLTANEGSTAPGRLFLDESDATSAVQVEDAAS